MSSTINKSNFKGLEEVVQKANGIIGPGSVVAITGVVTGGAPSVSSAGSTITGGSPDGDSPMEDKSGNTGGASEGSRAVTPTKPKSGFVWFLEQAPVPYKQEEVFPQDPDGEGRLFANVARTFMNEAVEEGTWLCGGKEFLAAKVLVTLQSTVRIGIVKDDKDYV